MRSKLVSHFKQTTQIEQILWKVIFRMNDIEKITIFFRRFFIILATFFNFFRDLINVEIK